MNIKSLALTLIVSLGLISCSTSNSNENSNSSFSSEDSRTSTNDLLDAYHQYVDNMIAQGKSPLSYDEWLKTIQGIENESTIDPDDGINDEQGLLFEYDYYGAVIVKIGTATELTSIKVPSKYKGENVAQIARFNSTKLQEILLPDTLTVIETECFKGCSELLNVNIPEGVTTIRHDAFSNCTKLKRIDLPKSLEEINSNAFGGVNSSLRVIYRGTAEDWKKIKITHFENMPLFNQFTIECSDQKIISSKYIYGLYCNNLEKYASKNNFFVFAWNETTIKTIFVPLYEDKNKNYYFDTTFECEKFLIVACDEKTTMPSWTAKNDDPGRIYRQTKNYNLPNDGSAELSFSSITFKSYDPS